MPHFEIVPSRTVGITVAIGRYIGQYDGIAKDEKPERILWADVQVMCFARMNNGQAYSWGLFSGLTNLEFTVFGNSNGEHNRKTGRQSEQT